MPRCDCQPLLQAPRVAVAMLRACSWPSIICRCERVRSGPGGDTRASLFAPDCIKAQPKPGSPCFQRAFVPASQRRCASTLAARTAWLKFHACPTQPAAPPDSPDLFETPRPGAIIPAAACQRGARAKPHGLARFKHTGTLAVRYSPPRGKIQGLRVRGRTARRQAQC